MQKRVIVVGGGAAGFFAALQVREIFPKAEVLILEKTAKPLSKVKVSGGGRCNVTNECTQISQLIKAYPRGGKRLKKLFTAFNTTHTQQWFEQRGVALYTQEDGRVFPVSDDSQTIIDCFYKEARQKGIAILLRKTLKQLQPIDSGWQLELNDETIFADQVILAMGGLSKPQHWEWMQPLAIKTQPPVPSLFTFNIPKHPVCSLMGVSVSNVQASIPGTKLKTDGPLLITHWGMSGPAILKLSAFGARILADRNYQFEVAINWADETNASIVLDSVENTKKQHPQKKVQNTRLYNLPERLWIFLVERAGIDVSRVWAELGSKSINKLVHTLTHDLYPVSGKTTFKEEFVTCGGIDWEEVNPRTMESIKYPNLFFAGEILDIDGITGGYNFQAAWTTGFIAGHLGLNC